MPILLRTVVKILTFCIEYAIIQSQGTDKTIPKTNIIRIRKYHNLYNDTRTITNRINRDVEKQKEIALRNTARLTALFGCKNLSVCRDLTPRLSVQGTAHSGTDAAAAGEIVPHRMLSLRGNRCNRERGLQIHTENAPTLRERVTISTTRIQKSTSRFWGNKLPLRGTIITAKLCRNRLTDRF